MADRFQSHPEGWYEAPNDPSRLRYWDGSHWTDQYRERTTQAEDSRSVPIASGSASTPEPVRFPVWFWLLLISATLGIFWAAAEAHDQSCYNKTLVQVTSGNLSESHCLILPWNDPAEGSGLR